jgi:O-antigen ligase
MRVNPCYTLQRLRPTRSRCQVEAAASDRHSVIIDGKQAANAAASIRSNPPLIPALAPHTEARLWSLALAFACLFVFTVPFHHALPMRTAALGLAALLTFVAGGWREVPLLPLRGPWAAWMAVAAASVILAQDFRLSSGEFRHEVLYAFFAYATWYTLARRREGARWLGRVLVASTIAALTVGVAVFAPGQPWFDLGHFGDVGTLSTYLVTVLPVFLLFAHRAPAHSAARFGAIALAACCLAAGSLTLNRTFWLATAAEITIFALFSMRYWNPRHRSLSMLAVAAVVAGLATVQVLLASESRIALAAPGTGLLEFLVEDPRGGLWQFAAGRIAEHPLIGAGLGKLSSREAFVAHFGDPLLMHAHNLFINRALETGLPGLLVFIVMLGSLALAFLRVSRSGDAGTAAIGAAGLAIVVGVCLKNLTDDFFVRQNALLFWSLVGAGLGAAAARQQAANAVAPS